MTFVLVRRLIILFLAVLVLASCATQADKTLNLDALDKRSATVDSMTSLMQAASSGKVSQMKQALLNGDLINAESEQGSAFSLALKAGKFAIAEFLLGIGALPSQGFKPGQASALMIAAESGQNSLVKKLILKGVDIDYQDSQGFSAIATATLNRHLTTMKILINAGVEVNVAPEGKSILQHMVIDNNPLLVQLLIKAGADVNFRTESGETALKMARRAGYYDLDLMLVQAGGRL